MTRAWAIVMMATLGGCGDAATDQSGGLGLPLGFQMTGEARLDRADGGVAECTLDLVFELRDEVRRDRTHVAYTGVHGGGMYRSVRAADDSGTTFWLNVFGDVEARLVFPDHIEIDIPINVGTGSRFYDNFSSLRGTLAPDGTGTGPWTCAPLDTEQDGHPDREHTAVGTWRIIPITIEPEPPEDDFMLE